MFFAHYCCCALARAEGGTWTPESTCRDRRLQRVHHSDAKKEGPGHFVVRMSEFVRTHDFIGGQNRFRFVIACVNALVAAGLDKSLKDSNGKTAAELADDIAEYQLRDLLARQM